MVQIVWLLLANDFSYYNKLVSYYIVAHCEYLFGVLVQEQVIVTKVGAHSCAGENSSSLPIRSSPCSGTKIDKFAAAEFAKQMLHMPGVVHSSPPLPVDAFQVAKTDDDFHFNISSTSIVPAVFGLDVPRCS
jgi:hypothetical protein